MPVEGELVVRLAIRDRRVSAVAARTERPAVASRLLPGRPADEAPVLMETLYAICGRSQGIAATAALEAARETVADAGESIARDRRIAAETLQEFAWRFLVDHPRLLGREAHVEALAEGRRLLVPWLSARGEAPGPESFEALEAWSRRAIFGVGPETFLALATIEDLHEWIREAATPVARDAGDWIADEPAMGACGVDLLPPGNDDWIAREFREAMEDDPAYEWAPVRHGYPCETGALARTERHPLVAAAARRWGRGVAARLVARLVETASLVSALDNPGAPRHGARAIGDRAAIAWVETARGLLVHRAALDDGRVASWRIVAPTEWNFHPEGPFARGALGLEAEDDAALRAKAMRLAASLDPCVAMRCEVGHA